jgi:2,3-bisphosphoglycerate-independent phosphoglycerate mutase
MKYIVVIADGMSDYPVEQLGGKTPLEYLSKKNMDYLANRSMCGMVSNVPDGMPPGSDVANLSVFGYNPKTYFSGRAPLEAASMGVEMDEQDVAFRCNLVTLKKDNGHLMMDDYSAGHIVTEEAVAYVDFLNKNLKNSEIAFYPGVSYRHLMIWNSGKWDMRLTPPHDIPDTDISGHIPSGVGSDFIWGLMKESMRLLRDSSLNFERVKAGKKEVSSIWLWGHGKKPSMPIFMKKFGITGSVIAAVDLIKGIGILAGLRPIKVPGATGYLDTNFEGKAEAAVKSLDHGDICFVHIEACDETSHEGSLEKKLKAIQYIDERFLKPLLTGLDKYGHYRILLIVDHPTPVNLKVHVADPVPFMIFDNLKNRKGVQSFSETECRNTGFYLAEGAAMMDLLLHTELD